MGEVLDRVIKLIEDKKDRVLSGKFNSIPINFKRFRVEFPGIEKGMYYQVTASTKVGKTQVTDHMFLYEPLKFVFMNKDKIRIHITYFTWEMSVEEKYLQAISRILFEMSKTEKRIEPKVLRSVSNDKIIPEEILNTLKEENSVFKEYLNFFEESTTFIDSIKNPTGVHKYIKEYAKKYGIMHKKKVKFLDKKTGEMQEVEIDDYYEEYDEDMIHIFIFDHLGLMSTEQGMDLQRCMQTLSAEYIVPSRNKYRFTFVAVIQQAAAQESVENIKQNRMKPTLDGYGDNKRISRDANYIFGLYAPHRFNVATYGHYDIEFFKDNIRFLELIAGREGGGGTICPLYFDGAVNYFAELPKHDDTANILKIKQIINKIRSVNNNTEQALLSYDKKIKNNVIKLIIKKINRRWQKYWF